MTIPGATRRRRVRTAGKQSGATGTGKRARRLPNADQDLGRKKRKGQIEGGGGERERDRERQTERETENKECKKRKTQAFLILSRSSRSSF
jgi:hypothetical protein